MTRKTSVEAYNRIKEDGLLGRLQFQVYEVLYYHGPLTQNELHQYHFSDTQPRNIQPRVSELVDMGAAECVGEAGCRVTGHKCMLFDVTGDLPAKVDKGETHDQLTIRVQKERIEFLGERVEYLENEIKRIERRELF